MTTRRERMASVDTAWLRMDHPTNLMMITGVLTFGEPLPYTRLQELVQERLLRFDRFRQRAVDSTPAVGLAEWEVDPQFDLGAHLRRAALPSPAGKDELQLLVSELMSVPLNPDRPLWQFHLVENYGSGSALIARLHHSIADGIALVRVLLSLTDEEAQTASAAGVGRRRRRRGLLGRATQGIRKAAALTESAIGEGFGLLRDPARAVALARMSAGGVARLGQILVRAPDPQTAFKGSLGVEKRAVWSAPIPLTDVKAVGRVTGGTVNDVLLTAVAGALGRYLRTRGEVVDGLDLHAVVPVNLRPLDGPIELGNRFGLVFLNLPVGIGDPVRRLEVLKQRMDALKQSPEAIAVFGLLNVVGPTPAEIENVLVNIFGSKATAVMTNVPGPRQQLYLAGAPLDQIMFWVPQSGRLGLGVSILSYNGEVLVGVATDARLVPDPEALVAAFEASFAEMMRLVELVRADPEAAAPGPTPAAPRRAPLPAEPAARRAALPARCRALTRAGKRCRNRARTGSVTCHVHGDRELDAPDTPRRS
ncbi:MAG: wax ester/triacylglycerol synthase family O-acyltransferase [Candidatus Promineifilaceae bacterium]|nr:wax ester/triacylglycerol synthase family O-acyltransferase [Candidatus Promineifilaceae bacterium]